MIKKITAGFVIQEFTDKGRCISQEFICGDDITYEDDKGDNVEEPDSSISNPYDMIQPIFPYFSKK